MTCTMTAFKYARGNCEKGLADLKELVAIPTISGKEECACFVKTGGTWLAEKLRQIGMARAEFFSDCLVYSESPPVMEKPTVLLYGHFDVKGAGRLEEWESFPFDPRMEGVHLYARGAADMKGSLWALLQALEALLHQAAFPLNVKLLLDGEQSVGSPRLPKFIQQNARTLACDFALSLDGEMFSDTLACIDYGGRGLVTFDIDVTGRSTHAGKFGGIVANAAEVLCQLAGGLKDAAGRIALPNFYDSVAPIGARERELLAVTALNYDQWRELANVDELVGEDDFTPDERVKTRPALDVMGLKTRTSNENAIPDRALARVTVRLVPNQTAEGVFEQLKEYVGQKCPRGVHAEVRAAAYVSGYRADVESAFLGKVAEALSSTFGSAPLYRRTGASNAVLGAIQQHLGVGPAVIGFRTQDSGGHAVNERQHVPSLLKGIDAMIRLLMSLGETEES